MSQNDAIRRLLSGEINPAEIDENPSLYSMAERIYGAEALEGMGIVAPEISGVDAVPQNLPISSDVSLPDYVPDMNISKSLGDSSNGSRRYFVMFFGITGFAGVLFNMVVGVGTVLCSLGVANNQKICNDQYGQTKVVWTEAYSYSKLQDMGSWVKPMSDPMMGDIALIILFVSIAILGFKLRKKSVHSSDMLPLDG